MPDVPMLHRLPDYLRFYAQLDGTRQALSWSKGELDYAKLAALVENCAAAMVAAGVEHGSRVAFIGPCRAEYWITFLATSMIGGIWVGINPRYRGPEILHILADSAPVLLFSVEHFDGQDIAGLVETLIDQTPAVGQPIRIGCVLGEMDDFAAFLRTASKANAETVRARRDATLADDPTLLVYTSGTTGKPKGALLTHRGLIGRAVTQNATWPCDDIRTVNFLPVNHIGCVGFISIYALVGGGTQVLLERFDPESFLDLVKRGQVTVWISLPTVILMVLQSPSYEPAALTPLRWIIWSGATLPRGVIAELRRCRARLGASYGLTESSGSVTYLPLDADDALLSRSIGQPVPKGEARLGDPNGLVVPPGIVGEIQVRPEWAMKGYYRLEAASKEVRTPDGWLRTGDLGRADEQGRIELVGRLKEVFKSGGYNVYPREIELVIEAHPAVSLCAVVPVPDARFQEVGAAYVQPRPGTNPGTVEILTWCRERLANYKIPKHILFVDKVPTLSVGKIDRQALRLRAAREMQMPDPESMEGLEQGSAP